MECRSKHEELREEAGERRDTSQREQCQRHNEGQVRVCAVESVVSVAVGTSGLLFNDADDAEYCQVCNHIDCQVINQRGDTLSAVGQCAKHQITGLRDTTVSHESFHVFLQYGKEVSYGDCDYDDNAQHQAPVFYHLCENLHHDGCQRKGCSTFGYL